MKKIFIVAFLFLLRITNAQNFYKPLEKETGTDLFILNQKQVDEIFNKEFKSFIIELPSSNLTTKKYNARQFDFKSKDFKVKDAKGNLIKSDKNTTGLIYNLFDTETNENQGIIGIRKNQIDVELQHKRLYISIHEKDTTKKYKVQFGEIDKAFQNIKKKIEDSKNAYASNSNEIILKDLVNTEQSPPLTTFCSKPIITTTQTKYLVNDTLRLSVFRTSNIGSTDESNLLYSNFIYPNGDTTSLTEWSQNFEEEVTLPVKNSISLSDSGWYYIRYRQNGCPTTLDSIKISFIDTIATPNRPTADNEYTGKSGGDGCRYLTINFDVSYDYYQRCNKDASKAVYKVTYVFNFVKKIFDEIAIPLKLGDIRVSTTPEGLSDLNAFNKEGWFNIPRVYCSNAWQKFWCNTNAPFAGFQVCEYPSEFRSHPPEYKYGIFDGGKSILWEWKRLMYTNNSNTIQWNQLNDESPELCFLIIDRKLENDFNDEFDSFSNPGNWYTDISSYASLLPYGASPHINLFSNFKNKVDKYTGCYTRFIGCSQRRGLLLNGEIDHPYFQSFTSINYKDILRDKDGLDEDRYSQGGSVNVGVEGVNITNIGILPFFGDSALPTNVTEETTWKKYIYATDNGNGTVVLPDDAQYRFKTTQPTDFLQSKYIVNNNFYRQINTSYPMFNTLNANAYMLIYNICNLLGVEAKTSEHKKIFNSILSPLVDVNRTNSISSVDLITRDYTIPTPDKAHSAPDFISWDRGFLSHEIDYMRGIFNNPPNGYMDNFFNVLKVPYAKIKTNRKNYVVGDVIKLTTDVNSSNKNFHGQPYNWYQGNDIYDYTNNLPSSTIPTTYRWTGPNNYTSTERENNITVEYGNAPYGGVQFNDYYLQKFYTDSYFNKTCSSNVAKIRIKIYPIKNIPLTESFVWEDLTTLSGNKKFKWGLQNWDFIGPFSGTDFETDYFESRRSVGSRAGGFINRKFGTFNALNEPTFISGTGWTNPKQFNSNLNWTGLAYQARSHAYDRNAIASNPGYFEWPNDAYDGWYGHSYDITKYRFSSIDFGYQIPAGEYFFGPVPRNYQAFRDMNQTYGGTRTTVRYPISAGYDYWRKNKADTARSPIYINTLQNNGLALVFDYSHAIGNYTVSSTMLGRLNNSYDATSQAQFNGHIDGDWNSGHLIGEYLYSQYNLSTVPLDSVMIYAYFSGNTTPKLIYKKSSLELATVPYQSGYKKEFVPDENYNTFQWDREVIDIKDYDTCSRVQFDIVYKNANSIYSASNNFYIKDLRIVRNRIKVPSFVPDSIFSGTNPGWAGSGITRCDSSSIWTVSLPEFHNVNQIRIQAYRLNEGTGLYELINTLPIINTPDLTSPFTQTIDIKYKNFMVTRPGNVPTSGGQFRSPVYLRATAINSLVGSTTSDVKALYTDCNVGKILAPTFTTTGYSYGGYRIFVDGKGSIEFNLPPNHRGKYLRLFARTTTGANGTGYFFGGYTLTLLPFAPIVTLPNYNTRKIKVNFGITSNEPYTINLPALPPKQAGFLNPAYEFQLFSSNTPQFADFTKCCTNIEMSGSISLLEQQGTFPNFYNNSDLVRIKNCGGQVGCMIPPDVTGDPAQSNTGDFLIKIQYPRDHRGVQYKLYESNSASSIGSVIATATIPNPTLDLLFVHQITNKPTSVYFYTVETIYSNSLKTYSTVWSEKVNNPNSAIACGPTSIQVINSTRSKFEYKFTLSNNCYVPEGYKVLFTKCNDGNGLLTSNPSLTTEQVKSLPLGVSSAKNIGNDVTDNVRLTQQEISQNFFQRTVLPKLSIANCWYKIDVICTTCPTANKITTIYTYVTNN
jgi:hypothetical protein